MDDADWLAARFEEHRSHLRGVAYRMLGSATEADDAVQESWLRLSRTGAEGIDNLGGWLTTVVARVSLNMLRSRASTDAKEPLDDQPPEPRAGGAARRDPEDEALLADSVGLALLVVLDTLTPAERLAFVLHDMFAVPFDDIAPIVDRSPDAARQLASRARRRVRGAAAVPEVDLVRQRELVDVFLAAACQGDFDGLVAVLDPDVALYADANAGPPGAPRELHGATVVASSAATFSARARFSQVALVNGSVGLVVAPRGHLFLVLGYEFGDDRITGIDVIADPDRLRHLDLAVLDA